MSYKAKIKWDD